MWMKWVGIVSRSVQTTNVLFWNVKLSQQVGYNHSCQFETKDFHSFKNLIASTTNDNAQMFWLQSPVVNEGIKCFHIKFLRMLLIPSMMLYLKSIAISKTSYLITDIPVYEQSLRFGNENTSYCFWKRKYKAIGGGNVCLLIVSFFGNLSTNMKKGNYYWLIKKISVGKKH